VLPWRPLILRAPGVLWRRFARRRLGVALEVWVQLGYPVKPPAGHQQLKVAFQANSEVFLLPATGIGGTPQTWGRVAPEVEARQETDRSRDIIVQQILRSRFAVTT
jgi:hypothetical protein